MSTRHGRLMCTQIKEESFLEDVNNILQSGEVPNLYGRDEIPQVLDGVRKGAKQAGVEETTEALWRFFVDRYDQHRRAPEKIDLHRPSSELFNPSSLTSPETHS